MAVKLTLGARKLKRLLRQGEQTPHSFALAVGVHRLKISRILNGAAKRVEIGVVVKIVRAFPTGTLRCEDFAPWTVDEPDDGEEVARRLRAVSGAK